MLIFIIAGLAWCVIGYWGYIYWERVVGDVKLVAAIFGLFISVLGPLSWMVGYIIVYGEDIKLPNPTIFNKKKQSKAEDAAISINKLLYMQGKITAEELRNRTNAKIAFDAVNERWEEDKKA